MNTLKFKNGDLFDIQKFLGELKLSGRASRGRSKFIKLIELKKKDLQEDLNEARKPYLELDENGVPITENDMYKFKDESAKEKASEEMNAVFNEDAIFDITEHVGKIKALYEALVNYPYELEGAGANSYDLLLDQLEKTEE
ncbi:hypothetical protein AB9M75_08265 [Lactobacillus sp. AN1001]